jgi:hypothetical protein
MFLAEAPLNTACQITDMPDNEYVRERGLTIGTKLKVLSRTSYGTMKVQVQDSDYRLQFRSIVAEKITVSGTDQ